MSGTTATQPGAAATLLQVSEKDIEYHVTNLIRKFEARNPDPLEGEGDTRAGASAATA